EELRALTGIQEVRPYDEFPAYFQSLVKASRKPYGYTIYHSYRPSPSSTLAKEGKKLLETKTDHNWAFKEELEKLARKTKKGFAIRTWIDEHFRLRLPLEPEQ